MSYIKVAGGLFTVGLMGLFSLCIQAQEFDTRIARNAWVTISKIENRDGIPSGLLHSMSLVETGQGMSGKMMPWPYTIGVNGTRTFKFSSAEEALAKLDSLRRLGFQRFDVTVGDKFYKRVGSTIADAYLARGRQDVYKLKAHHYGKRFPDKESAVTYVEALLDKNYDSIDIGLMQVNWHYHKQNFRNVSEAFDPYQNIDYAVSYLRQHRQKRDWWASVGRYHSATNVHAQKYIRNVWQMYQLVHRL